MSQTDGVIANPDAAVGLTLTQKHPGKGAIPWWVPVVLALPALIPLAASILTALHRGEIPTGFIQPDMPYYMANGRAHFDNGFHLLYANPYAGYNSPHIYFQPHIFLMGCLQQFGLDPGMTYNIFGLAALFFGAFVAARFYREIVGWNTTGSKLGLVCFFWGGGVLALTGLTRAYIKGNLNFDAILRYDPVNGWWMLNFGRNLVYPTEAYYHGVFLLCILFLVRRRFGFALALAALMSMSHPFTGIEAILIVLAFLALERFLGDRKVKPIYLMIGASLLILHLGYYVFFLRQFADHRALLLQWQGPGFEYKPPTFLPALFLVGLLALLRLSFWPGLRKVWQEPQNRLFIVWFVIVFGLTQHDLLMKASQPIHFAHGYDWMALFFLSAPLLVDGFDRMMRPRPPRVWIVPVSAFMLFFLLDNIGWFGCFFNPHSVVSDAIYLTPNEREVLNWLRKSAAPPATVVCSDGTLSYVVSTYSRVRSWAGFDSNTPYYDEKKLEVNNAFQHGTILPAWNSMHMIYVAPRGASGWKPPPNAREVLSNADFDIWDCPPAPQPKAYFQGANKPDPNTGVLFSRSALPPLISVQSLCYG